jgi:AcrR family transcriptional regulator
MSKSEELRRLVDAAMERAAARPWHEVTYREIVATAGMKLDEAYRLAPDKGAILAALSRQADAAVLAEPAAVEDGSARDRLFDVLMRRFDALKPYRAGLAGVAGAAAREPLQSLGQLGRIGCSMRAMLVAAGISTEGLSGALRVQGLVAIWAAAFRRFLRDETPDLSETMAGLDEQLRRAERWMQRCSWRPRRPDETAGEAPGAAPGSPPAAADDSGPQPQPL